MDTEGLIKLLNEFNVEYVIIGATAFPVHGYARATLDLDIFINPNKDNARQTIEVLKKFGYAVTDISIEDITTKKLLIRQYILETDIHPFVKGVNFADVWKNKVISKIGDTKAYFAGLEDLIKMKKAAARPKDIEDLKYLECLKKKIDQEKQK